jgi:hypothetical protein
MISQFLIVNSPDSGYRLTDYANYTDLTVRDVFVPPVSLAEKIKSAVPAPLKRVIRSVVSRG